MISQQPDVVYFKPRGIPLRELDEETLPLDGLEALRLCDLQGLYHEEAAEHMGISRATFGRIIEEARRIVADALVNGKALRIQGGKIQMTEKRKFQCADCSHEWELPFGTQRPSACPQCGSANFHRLNPGPGRGACARRGRYGRGGPNQNGPQGRGRMQAGKPEPDISLERKNQ